MRAVEKKKKKAEKNYGWYLGVHASNNGGTCILEIYSKITSTMYIGPISLFLREPYTSSFVCQTQDVHSITRYTILREQVTVRLNNTSFLSLGNETTYCFA